MKRRFRHGCHIWVHIEELGSGAAEMYLNYERMLSHVDCKASYFFRIFEAKSALTLLNFATTTCFTAQNAASGSVTGYNQLDPELEIPCLGPCLARFGKAGGLQFEGFPTESRKYPEHMWHMLREILNPSCLLVLYLSGRVFGFPEIA